MMEQPELEMISMSVVHVRGGPELGFGGEVGGGEFGGGLHEEDREHQCCFSSNIRLLQ